MVISTLSALETLSLLALERICQYLDNDHWARQNLWSFTLASRTCCSVAAARRFCQITLRLVPGELERSLKPWMDVLNHDGRYRHVCRLKVTSSEDVRSKKPDEYDGRWNIRHYFDMHDFCRPPENYLEQGWGWKKGPTEDPEFWVPLSRFINQIPGLQDLVWALGSHMPRAVLSAVTTTGCRLHMHHFSLESLIQFGDNPQPIDPDEYALATSSSLFSIVARVTGTKGYKGELDYNEEALMQMVAGMTPNLAYLCMTTIHEGQAFMLDEIRRLKRPKWSGFFCDGVVEANQQYVRGSLQSLVCDTYVPGGIAKWTHFTDFTKLRCLIIPYTPEEGVALTEIATRGDFQFLETLKLSPLEDETPNAQKVLQRLLESVNPLQRLLLDGYFTTETLNVVLRRHGATLRTLSMHTYLDDDDRDAPTLLVAFSKAIVEQLVAKCSNLEQIKMPIARTEGDDEEAGIYRALSRLPRLKDAVLMLGFWIGPDEDYWDEEKYGLYPPHSDEIYEAEQIPPDELRIAFRNCAIDSILALSIFNMIATSNSLRYLKIHTFRKTTRCSPNNQEFAELLRWFNRPWVCKREDAATVTVEELNEKATISCSKDWERASKNYQSKGYRDPNQDVFVDVFKSVWPPKTTEWWNDWESLPLS